MRVLVTGASGQLGGYLLRALTCRGIELVAWSGSHAGELAGVSWHRVELADAHQVECAFRDAKPDVVIHAGAVSNVSDCYRDPDRARLVNTVGTALLAELSCRATARLVYISTDLVFDGLQGAYKESDPVSPLSIYGRSKAEAEQAVCEIAGGAVVRMSLLYGPSVLGRPSFFDQQLSALRERRPFVLFEDEWRTPLDLATAAGALVEIARSDLVGVLHVGGPERMSRLEMGRRTARCLRLDPTALVASTRAAATFPEPRPRDTSLDSSRWRQLFPVHPWPSLEEAVRNLVPAASERSEGSSAREDR